MGNNCSCECSAAPKLIFACSGAADVGEIADRAARELTREGAGKMFCLAGIGGRIGGIMKTTESAQAVLALDGCPLECAKKSLEEAGFTDFEYLNLAELDMPKGQSEVSEANIAKVVEASKEKLASK